MMGAGDGEFGSQIPSIILKFLAQCLSGLNAKAPVTNYGKCWLESSLSLQQKMHADTQASVPPEFASVPAKRGITKDSASP